MAVEDKYTDALITGSTVTKLLSSLGQGAKLTVLAGVATIAAADDDGSVYRLFKSVSGNLIPLYCVIGCDAITSGTSYDLGLYKTNLGVVVDKDAFMATQTMATAVLPGPSTGLNGLGAVAVANRGKTIWELAGHTVSNQLAEGYDIALTANTVGSAAGSVSVLMICATLA
jgi:hypothetical protein